MHRELPSSRRDFLARAGGGLGLVALSALMEAEGAGPPSPGKKGPLAPKPPHFPARAKSVIWLFMDGGPSHIDTFDPKPALGKLAGKPLPASFPRPVTAMGKTANTPLLASKRKFAQYGKSGTWVSDWYPEVAKHVDKLAVLRGCHMDGLNHVGSICQMNTGSILAGRPCLGAWALYGLGTVSQDLPGYVVLLDNPAGPPGGARQWGTGFMPATYQGTAFRPGKEPVLHLKPPREELGGNPPRHPRKTKDGQREELDFIQALNRKHAAARHDEGLEARIASYELAYRMQSAAPEAVELSKESAATHKLYGVGDKKTDAMGRCCLMARRLVERGVRFVQVYCGAGSKWDAHANVESNHGLLCPASDRPIAGLLADLKSRGMLDSTLVIWGGEFGRTPMSESGVGRDHNPWGFTIWMAGGGIKGGIVHGATDEVGLYAIEGRAHVHDIHATILHVMGLDHKKLTLLHAGREERATINGGKVIKEVLA